MGRVRWTPAAERDLLNVTDYIAQKNPGAAQDWLRDILRTFDLLADQPELGQSRQIEQYGKLRIHSRGNYVILYQPLADGVEIIRIVHGARGDVL